MAENTAIEWATHTFNPWEGCQKVGPGCDHCYAETRNARYGGGIAANWGPGAPRRRTSPSNWRKPLAWNREAERTGMRPRVFCASLADVFDNAVDPEWRRQLFELIAITPNLDWLLLTKRIGNVTGIVKAAVCELPNVWLGATIVNQAEADRDIPKLLATPARVRFLSMEPLLGPVDLTDVKQMVHGTCAHMQINALTGALYDVWGGGPKIGDGSTLDWIIVGGESGPGARPMHPDWARSLRDQCAAAGVPFLFKQWGEWKPFGGWVDGVTRYADESGSYGADRIFRFPDRGPYAVRVGKKAAGRLLDGVQHDVFPTPDARRSRGG